MSYKIGPYLYYKPAIGKGSFSRVYQGYNVTSKQPVAVKKISKDALKKMSISRLNKEIELIKKLDHPNIVRFFDVIQYNTDIYIISEFCDGGDFSTLLKTPLSESMTKFYFRQLVEGLRYLQANNIVHRDLKPKNILLTKIDNTDILKIADFGFACQFEQSVMLETLCGTPLYMAPEIVKRNKYTPQTDLWSLGVILYEMLFHSHPYGKPYNLLDLIKKVEKNKIIMPKNNLSSDCESLLTGLLQVDPKKRISWEDLFAHPWLALNIRPDPVPAADPKPGEPHECLPEMRNSVLEEDTTPALSPDFKPQSYEGDGIFDLELDAGEVNDEHEQENDLTTVLENNVITVNEEPTREELDLYSSMPMMIGAKDIHEDYYQGMYKKDKQDDGYVHVSKPKYSTTAPTETMPIPIPRQKTVSSQLLDYVTGSIDFLRNSLSNLHSY